jgi:RimJ/RimL family protein N-acetyltransferase
MIGSMTEPEDDPHHASAGAACTARLRMEPLSAAHAPRLFPLLADPRLYTYVPDAARASVDLLAERFDELARGAPADAGECWLNWVLVRRDNDEAIGTLQATVEPDARAGIGYVLVSAAWGQGFATEACRWLVAELARRHAVREVLASVDVRNHKSIAVLERVGFERMAMHAAELHGEATNDYVYRMLCAP